MTDRANNEVGPMYQQYNNKGVTGSTANLHYTQNQSSVNTMLPITEYKSGEHGESDEHAMGPWAYHRHCYDGKSGSKLLLQSGKIISEDIHPELGRKNMIKQVRVGVGSKEPDLLEFSPSLDSYNGKWFEFIHKSPYPQCDMKTRHALRYGFNIYFIFSNHDDIYLKRKKARSQLSEKLETEVSFGSYNYETGEINCGSGISLENYDYNISKLNRTLLGHEITPKRIAKKMWKMPGTEEGYCIGRFEITNKNAKTKEEIIFSKDFEGNNYLKRDPYRGTISEMTREELAADISAQKYRRLTPVGGYWPEKER